MNRTDRKHQLVLACMSDRVAWVQACEPAPQPPLARAGHIIQMLEPIIGMLPGKIGRWIRNAHFVGSLLPTVGKYFLRNLASHSAGAAQEETAHPSAPRGKPRTRAPAGK
jgi:hypothetical protein